MIITESLTGHKNPVWSLFFYIQQNKQIKKILELISFGNARVANNAILIPTI